MANTILRESTVRKGRHIISVLEFASGEIVMYVDDVSTGIQEDIAIREYVNVY